MAFLPRLRMNNVFNGNMFTPLHGADVDPYEQIIRDFQQLQSPNDISPINGLNSIRPSSNRMPTGVPSALARPEALRFGGVVGENSNPGADILNRADKNTERLWQSYKEPQVTAGEILGNAGIKPNEQFPGFKESIDLDHQIKKANLDLAQRRVADAEKKTTLAEYKSKNPNLKFIPVKGGNVVAVNQQTGEHFDTGIDTGTMSEADAIIARGDETRKTNNAKPNETKPLDQARQIVNSAQKFQTDYPGWAKYVTIDGNKISIDHEAINDNQGGKNAYETIRQALYPSNYNPAPSNTNQVNNPPAQTPANNTAVDPTTKIRVKNKATGQTGTISAGAFNPEKYEKLVNNGR